MRRLLTTIVLLACYCGLWADHQPTLDSLYRALDAAIDSSYIYVQQKTDRLQQLKADLRQATSDSLRFSCARRLYEEYVPFDNDSAIAYQYQCLDIAQLMGRDDLHAETLLMLADQLTESGFYNEARLHFMAVAPKCQTGDLHQGYLSGLGHLYGEMGYYSHDPRLRQDFFAQAGLLRDSLLHSLDSTSADWLKLRTMMLVSETRPSEAMPYSDRWLESCQPGGRDFAIMLTCLADLGYSVEWRVVNSAEYGFPQRRKRFRSVQAGSRDAFHPTCVQEARVGQQALPELRALQPLGQRRHAPRPLQGGAVGSLGQRGHVVAEAGGEGLGHHEYVAAAPLHRLLHAVAVLLGLRPLDVVLI